jgi:hypothetical protein
METKVDDDDFEYLSKWKWKFHKSHGCDGGYAARTCYYKERKQFGIILMHRLLNKTPIDMFTDHINGDKLDNRKQNLRTVSAVSNMQNRGKQKNNTSGFRGLFWDKNRNKWTASFVFNKKTVFRKRFKDKEDAILAIQNAQKEYGVSFQQQQPELF